MEDIKIKNAQIIFSEKLELDKWKEKFKNSFTVFLHSANYKFSLGSGSSFLVKQIIDAETKQHGKSQLQKNIQKIRKTSVCGVQMTSGGNLTNFFMVERGDKIEVYPNFQYIVHCVIPGPRISDFENRVTQMLDTALNKVSLEYKLQNKPLFFCLPIIGINNFGYPVDFMLHLYAELLKNWITENQIEGTIFVWLRKEFAKKLRNYLKNGQ